MRVTALNQLTLQNMSCFFAVNMFSGMMYTSVCFSQKMCSGIRFMHGATFSLLLLHKKKTHHFPGLNPNVVHKMVERC